LDYEIIDYSLIFLRNHRCHSWDW